MHILKFFVAPSRTGGCFPRLKAPKQPEKQLFAFRVVQAVHSYGEMSYDKIKCINAVGEKRKNKILALQTTWNELSEFQQNDKQRDKIHKIRKH